MEIRKIFVPLSGRHDPEDPASLDAPALQTAVRLARRFDAAVEVLSVIGPPTRQAAGLAGWMPDYGMDAIMAGLAKQDEARRRNARKSYETHVASETAVRATFVEREGDIRATVGAAGRLSDLIVIASSQARWEQPFRPILDAVLRESARPIFVSAEVAPEATGAHVTIAWNDSPESARSLAGAMAMLRAATAVTVLVCRRKGEASDSGAVAPVLDYLDLHGVKARGREIIATGHQPAPEIIDAALADGSDLLVLGAAIHSRTHSLVYGSLTEEVLKSPRLSALLVP